MKAARGRVTLTFRRQDVDALLELVEQQQDRQRYDDLNHRLLKARRALTLREEVNVLERELSGD